MKPTLPKTNSSHLKIGRAPKGKDHLPTIHFQVLLLLVSGRVKMMVSKFRISFSKGDNLFSGTISVRFFRGVSTWSKRYHRIFRVLRDNGRLLVAAWNCAIGHVFFSLDSTRWKHCSCVDGFICYPNKICEAQVPRVTTSQKPGLKNLSVLACKPVIFETNPKKKRTWHIANPVDCSTIFGDLSSLKNMYQHNSPGWNWTLHKMELSIYIYMYISAVYTYSGLPNPWFARGKKSSLFYQGALC